MAAYHNQTSPSRSPNVPFADAEAAADYDAAAMGSGVPGYLSAQDIADLALAGLPATKRRINDIAARDNWPFVDRVGRGGGRLYATASLPAAALKDLLNRRLDIVSQAGRGPGRPAGSGFFADHPDVASAVETILSSRRLAAPRILELLASDFAQLPEIHTLRRYIARIESENPALIASVRNPDAYKGKHRIALGRADANCTRAHECWELDTTVADVMTAGGRVMILGLIDRWSRRAAFMVAPSESGQSVRNILVGTIRKWGVMPEAVMTDNGSGYINVSIKSALEALGIEHRICPPGAPEKKPHIERLFGTFTRERAEILAGYSGHNVAQATELRARARKATGRAVVLPEMTGEQLQAVLDAWVDGVYHQRVHGSLRMTPMRKWQSSPAPARAAPSEDVLRLALSALVGTRTIGKRGLVWQNGRYWSPALAAWVGREVIVRRDEHELGELFVFAPDGTFIDVARNAMRAGLSEEAFARLAREQQDSYMKSARADLKARSRHFDFDRARDALLRRDAEAAGKLVHLPPPVTAHSTPTIDSLGARSDHIADAGNLMGGAPTSEPVTAQIIPLARTPEQKVREADAIIARFDAGEDVPAEIIRRARFYQTTSEYRSEKTVADYFAAASGAASKGESA